VPVGLATNWRDPLQDTGPDSLRKAVRDEEYSVISATVMAIRPMLRMVSRVVEPTLGGLADSYDIARTPVRHKGSFD
jgi:hypothetical protein